MTSTLWDSYLGLEHKPLSTIARYYATRLAQALTSRVTRYLAKHTQRLGFESWTSLGWECWSTLHSQQDMIKLCRHGGTKSGPKPQIARLPDIMPLKLQSCTPSGIMSGSYSCRVPCQSKKEKKIGDFGLFWQFRLFLWSESHFVILRTISGK